MSVDRMRLADCKSVDRTRLADYKNVDRNRLADYKSLISFKGHFKHLFVMLISNVLSQK